MKAPRDVFQALVYLDTLPESSSRNFLRFKHYTFESEEALKDGVN